MNTTQRVLVLVLFACLALPPTAAAKRPPAPAIPPIVHNGVRYTAPNDKGTVGYVVAQDAVTGKQLWKKTLFRKLICPFLEHDVQWVFLRQMRLDGERLLLINERDKTCSLDLRTRKVRKLSRADR